MERTSGLAETVTAEVDLTPLSAAIMFNISEQPGIGQTIGYAIDRDLLIPEDALGSVAICGTAPAADATVSIQLDGSEIGTIVFEEAALVGTFTLTEVLLTSGRSLSLVFPDPADTSLADVEITIQANRGNNPGEELTTGVNSWNGRIGNVLPAEADYTASQVANNSDIDGDTVADALNKLGGGSAAWGGITGTLADQTDLQAALDAKQATSTIVETIQDTMATALGTPGTGVLVSYNDVSGEITLSIDEASAGQIWANTANKVITTDAFWSAQATVTLTDAATILVDMGTFINAKVTLAGNRTLGAPSNAKVGQTGCIEIIQDGTGSRTLAYHSDWYFGGTDPVLTTAAGARDVLFYQVLNDSKILGIMGTGTKAIA